MRELESDLSRKSDPVAVQAGRIVNRPLPKAILPGAFNPLHQGHRKMAQVSAELLGHPVDFEISRRNVDKATVTAGDLQQRLQEFAPDQVVWITSAATFEQKSSLFPRVTFVVGVDTLTRIADPLYYGGDTQGRDRSLLAFSERESRFLVFGRLVDDRFCEFADLNLPEPLRSLCRGVPRDDFRVDISSAELRDPLSE